MNSIFWKNPYLPTASLPETLNTDIFMISRPQDTSRSVQVRIDLVQLSMPNPDLVQAQINSSACTGWAFGLSVVIAKRCQPLFSNLNP